MRQQAPGTVAPKYREARIQDFRLGVCLKLLTELGAGHQMFDQIPFFVA
jgi:hypothetical protein